MELSPGPNPVPDRLFSIRTRFPVLVVEKRSVTAVPESMGIDVWKGAALKWEAERFADHRAFPFDLERALDTEPTPKAKKHLPPLFTPEEASAVLDLLAAEVPSGTHSLTAVELPTTGADLPVTYKGPAGPHMASHSTEWGEVLLGGKTTDKWGTLASLSGSYQLDAAEYVETIDPAEVDTPAVGTPIRPLSDLEDAVETAREHVELDTEIPF